MFAKNLNLGASAAQSPELCQITPQGHALNPSLPNL